VTPKLALKSRCNENIAGYCEPYFSNMAFYTGYPLQSTGENARTIVKA